VHPKGKPVTIKINEPIHVHKDGASIVNHDK